MNKEEESHQPQARISEGDDEEVESEEDEELKICQVCGDRATGYHFNAMTCEGCKGFFRRAMKKLNSSQCLFQNACVINKSNRRQCQACRLQKCQSIGMLKELIMSDEDVEKRRCQIKRRKMKMTPIPLSPHQEDIIRQLLKAHKDTLDMTCSEFSQFRPLCRATMDKNSKHSEDLDSSSLSSSFSTMEEMNQEEKRQKKSIFTSLSHISDMSTYMIQNVINFAKEVPAFRSLIIEDQISLLKGATFEILLIRFNMFFNENTGIWECGPHNYTKDDVARAGFQHHFVDPLLKFHYKLRRLHLDDVEYVLMQALALFSPDRPGITQFKDIDLYQETLAITLKTYIDSHKAETGKRLLYPKIMACLTEMRTMNEEHTKQLLHIHDVQPEVSPLMLEVFSNC
ncbi:nuclear receptor subfamily 1 group I member 2 isoform X2 [Denticeps clupeoides]|nr:nuclear receptor subfamily 1 group I member 2 isoform X2 [Denticeps clupeoides]